MATLEFDATITISDCHLIAAGLCGRGTEAVAMVRQAIEGITGAGWIDVVASDFPPSLNHSWIVIYPRGRCITPETPLWTELRRRVEETARTALLVAGAPF
jgi:hypothetical protein